MEYQPFNTKIIDPSWQICLKEALAKVDPHYLEKLHHHSNWLPGAQNIFNAFTLPVNQINYVLLGESPYPRAHSANGYAFWDAAVTDLWSLTGLSKAVNRATSLRNIIKMLLVAEGLLQPNHTSQADIANIDKQGLVHTNQAFFQNFIRSGFLLLNASLVLQATPVRQDAAAWYPFIEHVLSFLLQKRPQVTLILFGQIAHALNHLTAIQPAKKLIAEHPYNISFIHHPQVIEFFKPLHLLMAY